MPEASAPRRLYCPWLGVEIELTAERERHIQERHPDLLPAHRGKLVEVLADPDMIRRSARTDAAWLFSRWYTDLRRGRHVVVVVLSEENPARHWIVTAYTARSLAVGEIAWHRS